jgi:predicted dehydrogenase
MKTRVAIIGNGLQVRKHHLPYLQTRSDVELYWASGCTCTPSEIPDCPLKRLHLISECGEGVRLSDWKVLLENKRPEAVVISNPNSMHAEVIRCALKANVHVAVDKPPTISPSECMELVDLAAARRLVFLTISQRRYEDVYQAMAAHLAPGELGEIRMINYFAAHSFTPVGWRKKLSLAGGGILMDTAFHGIDTILWMLKQSSKMISPVRISADWILDTKETQSEQVELFGSIRIVMNNGCIFNISASYENPRGSVDESIKIFGELGTLRYVRDKLVCSDMSAGVLTFQRQTGDFQQEYNGQSLAKRSAPLADFLDAIASKTISVQSPASDSISVLRILNCAYESARQGGIPIEYTS